MAEIRNIQQSVQYRDVVKQASDILVYIDGRNYLINPFLNNPNFGISATNPNQSSIGVIVPINDYVQSWSSTYDLDSMIPSGTLALSVPVQDDHLFRAPGGNNILKTMSEIRVFAKGYYLSQNGNTLYRQIFKGFISSINYNVTGKINTISMSCFGSLGLLERMQVDQSPAVMSNSPQEITPYISTTWNLDPYEQIAWVFLYSSMVDAFTIYSLDAAAADKEASSPNSIYYQAINSSYVAKWQALLFDLARDTHIFGVDNVTNVIDQIIQNSRNPDEVTTPFSKEYQAMARDKIGKESEISKRIDRGDFFSAIRKFMPDMGVGSIKLTNGTLTSRLERLRYMVSQIGFEAYQDVDGGIVIKPPLYNLDVLDLGNFDPNVGIRNDNNPFVVQLSEIINEAESENEAAVRLTRITARGNFLPGFQTHIDPSLLSIAEELDIPKMAQFGLRAEPPVVAHWFEDGDVKSIYAFAVSELAKANRGFKSYSITIPFRPELKLGFPMYIPHRDMYGYIKNISMNWTRGSSATTSVQLDSLRSRPVFPETQQYTPPASADNPQPQPTKVTLMTPRPNLVMQWTKPTTDPNFQNPDALNNKVAGSFVPSLDTATQGSLATLPLPQQLVYAQELQYIQARQRGSSFGPNSDNTTNSWQAQVDANQTFVYERSLDASYYSDLQATRPYTDAKGYELIGPFPWGRWQSLTDCVNIFTINANLGAEVSPALSQAINPVNPGVEDLNGVEAFLFSGNSTVVSDSSATDVIYAMTAQAQTVNNYKVFELSYYSGDDTSSGPGSTLTSSTPTPNSSPSDTVDNRSQTLFSGVPTAQDSLVGSIIDSITPSDAITDSEQVLG